MRARPALESEPTVVAFDVMHLSKVNDSATGLIEGAEALLRQ